MLEALKDHIVVAQYDFAIFILETAIKDGMTMNECLEILKEMKQKEARYK